MTHDIRRGVSLYSYQDETFMRRMSLEDCIAVSAGFGAHGIEVLSEQSFPNYPAALTPQVYEDWRAMLRRHDAVPVCHDAFLDTRMVPGRLMTFDEQVASCKLDIDQAARLGCPHMRALVFIDPDVLVACAEHAERQGVHVLVEVHAPLHFDHPWIIRHAEAFDRCGSSFLGFMPDMGMFLHRFPPVWKARFIRMGVPQVIADHIEQAYMDRTLSEYVIHDVELMGGTGPALAMATTLRHNAAYEPRRMLPFMDRIHHIHGKFYQMTEDGVEPSIPYDQIIDVLKQGGYRGYICSEYEGNRWIEDAFPVNCVRQVELHQQMLSRLIGTDAAPEA